MSRSRTWLAALVTSLAGILAAGPLVGCGPAKPPPAPPTPSPAKVEPAAPSPVVVTIVVDQLGAWVAESKWPALPATGGFARLRREGTWVTELRYAHAVTDTAPGHAALYTGATPRDSGIFANEVLDEKDERTSILADGATRTVTLEGELAKPSSSIARLRVPTLADALMMAHPRAIVVGLSLKDRGAIFGCGHHPAACLWLGKGELVGSSAFGDGFPAWAEAHGGPAAVHAWTDFVWKASDEAWLRAHATGPDDRRGEGRYAGLGTTFPHDFAHAEANAVRVSPRADAGLLDVGADAIDALHGSHEPILLAISLSTNDYVGHVYGPGSWEAWQEMRDLDASLAHFLDRLDRTLGPNGYAVVLSADHGVTPLPETAPSGTSGRISPDDLAKALGAAAKRAGFPGAVRGVADPYVVLSDAARALPPPRRAALDKALRRALASYPGVRKVYFAQDVPGACPTSDDEDALVCRSIPSGAGDVYVAPKAGWFFDTLYVPGAGTSHGTATDVNRTVPLLVRAPGRVAAGAVQAGPLPFAAFTRTAAALLGVAPPRAAEPAPSLASPPPAASPASPATSPPAPAASPASPATRALPPPSSSAAAPAPPAPSAPPASAPPAPTEVHR